MIPVPVPAQTRADALAVALDSNTRFAAGDFTVTEDENTKYRAMIAALKAAGVSSPFMEILDCTPGVVNFRTCSVK